MGHFVLGTKPVRLTRCVSIATRTVTSKERVAKPQGVGNVLVRIRPESVKARILPSVRYARARTEAWIGRESGIHTTKGT